MSGEELRLNQLKNNYRSYYKNYLLLLTLGLIWSISAYVGTFDIQISIFLLFVGITLFKPALFCIGKVLGAPKIYNDESLQLLTRLIILGILFGLVVGFFPFTENINLFFPTFTIIFGLIFGAISYSTGLKMYGFLSVILISGGVYTGYYHSGEFAYAGFFSGFIMAGLGVINGIFGKKARISFQFLNKKLKKNIATLKIKPRLYSIKKADKTMVS